MSSANPTPMTDASRPSPSEPTLKEIRSHLDDAMRELDWIESCAGGCNECQARAERALAALEKVARYMVALPALLDAREDGVRMREAVAKLVGRLDQGGYVGMLTMDSALGIGPFIGTDVGAAIREAMRAANLTARRDDRGFLEFSDAARTPRVTGEDE